MIAPVASRFDQLARSEQQWRGYLDRIQARDAQSLARLYDETSAILYGLAVRMLPDPAAAEEVILDVYAEIWKPSHEFDSKRGSVLAHLTGLTRKCAVKRLRSSASRTLPAGVNLAADSAGSVRISAAEGVFARERKLVQRALEMLPAEERAALELAFFGGLSEAELERALEVPAAVVKRRIRAGMSKLREVLEAVAPLENSA